MAIRVAIDAGHGSNTAGKRTPDGYREHYINVKTAYYLEQFLKKYGIETVRIGWNDTNATDDADTPLSTRQSQVKNAKCDYSISCHANAYGSGGYNSAKGVETLISNTPSYQGDSLRLAKKVQAQLIKGTSQNNRGVKLQSLAMCNCAAMKTKASILCEIGFMTNEYESGLMKKDEFCKEQGEDIARGFLDYVGINYNVVTTNPKPITSTQATTQTTTSTKVNYIVKINTSELNVRKEPNASSKVVTVVKRNQKYTIIEERNGWGKLKSGAGWIKLSYTVKC